jgi:copper chaperone NosL
MHKAKVLLSSLLIASLLWLPARVLADEAGTVAPKPTKQDKCPVCGMFTYRYPDFLSSITYADGHKVFFDGAKDMFKYYFNLQKYAPGRSSAQIARIFVTEYYDMHALDARKAFYVVGSDVYGPMGHELIPFASPDDAEAFFNDHKGRRILTFETITPAVIKRLD